MQTIDGRPCLEVQLDDNFVYLGDCICSGVGCELATIKRCRSAWAKFRKLLLFLTCKAISLNTHDRMYNSCVTGTMRYLSQFWALRQDDKVRA